MAADDLIDRALGAAAGSAEPQQHSARADADTGGVAAGLDETAAGHEPAVQGEAPVYGEAPGASMGRDEAAVRRFVERFASILVESGIPRMPARVFAALLTTDSGSLTAAELAEMLHVSPAAISGAVRYLTQVSLVTREREPGSRRDLYRLYDEVLLEIMNQRDQVLARWESGLREGLDAVGSGTPAGTRLAETVAFFEFIRAELSPVLKRWREHKSARH